MPLLGVKRTGHFAPHMSAFDPKRTSAEISSRPVTPACCRWILHEYSIAVVHRNTTRAILRDLQSRTGRIKNHLSQQIGKRKKKLVIQTSTPHNVSTSHFSYLIPIDYMSLVGEL